MNFSLIGRYLKILASYRSGYPLYAPDSVSIVVTDKCNLKCEMCNFWKDSGKGSNILTTAEFGTLFKDLRSLRARAILLTGGEPFLRNDLNEILASAKLNGLNTTVITNGTLINEDNILRYLPNIDLFYVSLDAPSKNQHEGIRGVSDIFERIIKSIRLLVKAIKDNSFSSRVVICSTITPKNIHDPAEMVALAKDLGVNGVIYNPASAVTYGHTTLKSALPESRSSLNAYCEMVDKVIKLMSDSRNLIRSNPFYLTASKEFLNGNDRYYKFPCYTGGYNGPLIGFDGSVFPCCAWNVSLGNIREQSFSKIWTSGYAKDIRMKIKKGKCQVCYHHNRTFDFVVRAPLLFRDFNMLLEGYKTIFRTRI